MSARFISKEDMPACERWEFSEFGEKAPSNDPDVQFPTAAEIQALHEQAIREGYNAGASEVQAQAASLAAILQSAESARHDMQDQLAERILALSLDIANQVVRTALKIHPEMIVALVREAIQTLPGVHGDPLLVLNPADAEVVRKHLSGELERDRWRISVDPKLTPGGCRIETNGGDIDATVGKRWERVMDALGTDHAWIE